MQVTEQYRQPYNLQPIHEGYQWLVDNPQHFSMLRYLGRKTPGNLSSEIEFMVATPVNPACGTTFCLCGAILLCNAIKIGQTNIEIPANSTENMDKVSALLRAANNNLPVPEDLRKDLVSIFMGTYFERELNAGLSSVTLEILGNALQSLYKTWETPQEV
jgi:hypothetical protein